MLLHRIHSCKKICEIWCECKQEIRCWKFVWICQYCPVSTNSIFKSKAATNWIFSLRSASWRKTCKFDSFLKNYFWKFQFKFHEIEFLKIAWNFSSLLMFLDIFYFLVNFFSYSALLNELVIVTRVVNLPLLEPLTTEKLNSLMAIGCSCMLVGSALADAQHQQLLQRNSAECSQEDREFDELAHNIADKCVKKIFSFFFLEKFCVKIQFFCFCFCRFQLLLQL